MCIRFALRWNLIHLGHLILWNTVRKIESILMGKLLGYGDSLINTLFMFIGEFLAGLILFLMQKKSMFDKRLKSAFFEALEVNSRRYFDKQRGADTETKKYFLIFICAFFDFVEFTISIKCLSKFLYISGSLEWRLTGILTISSSLFLFFVMKFQIFKHQKVCLIFLSSALGVIILDEFIFQKVNIFLTYLDFVYALAIIFFIHFFTSLNDVIEKYLFEFDSLNEYKTLMWEGIFGIILTLIYCAYDSPFYILSDYYNSHPLSDFLFLLLALVIYVFLSGGRNALRVYVNKIYSPIVKTLTDYFINPIYIIYYFSIGEDFIINGSRNVVFFIINLLCSLIITFFGCVYNEFIVLDFCDLGYYSYDAVSKRASELERYSITSVAMEEQKEEEEENKV